MQKVQGLLPAKKAPVAMHLATDLSIDLCKKLLCGERRETAATLEALLRSDLGREVLFALMGDARPDWFIKYSRQLDIYAAQQQLDQSTKAIAALQAGLSK
jgi:hypothetical protein